MRAFGGQRAVEGLLSCLLAAIIVLHSSAPALAAPPADPYGVAVIVGNRNYTHEDRRGRTLPAVEFAHRDAAAFKRYVIDVLGYAPENVIELSDATKAEMEAAFGNANNYQGRLWQFIHPKRGADVVVFYSGHGVPGLKDKRGYLLPSNADPNNPEINGYPLDLLYENLGKLKAAKLVRVYLDACFSGDSDQGMLLSSASPSYVSVPLPESVGDRFSVLTAASGEEVASWDERAGHGLFTHHLLDALYGKGDEDGDGKVTAREAKAWLDDHMTYAAQRRFGRVQNATLSGEAGLVLAHAGAGGAFPERRMLEALPQPNAGAAARGKKDRAGQDKTQAPTKAPSEILLPDGLRLSDWALLAEDRLARRDYRALLVEGVGHLRAHGVHASVQLIVDRAFAGLVEGLSVTDEASAREALGSVKRLRGVVGDRVELSALGAQAHERLGQREGAAVAYRSWLELAPADHPQRKDILLALQRAERGEAAAVPAKPVAGPADVESGLGLTRGDRRSIQSGLASLGFAAGPADGLFGKRTRDAISSWQEAKGEEPTGYLTRTEAEALKAAGEEARRAAAERERKAHAAAEAQRRAKAEEARKARARRAETSTHGREFDDCGGAGWCPRMVVLPAGSFTMGSPSSEKGRERDEGPQHVVTIPRPFAVGKYEVTFEEWDACVRGGGCPHRLGDKGWGRGRRPVINVSWKDAQDYVRWLSRETGKEYRLLTEAEWEYAARAGTTGPV